MDLTKILPGFFQSGCGSITEYTKLLKETAAQDAWVSAVNLWRTGMKKIYNKDLTGMEDIKKANEELKIIVKDYDTKGNLKTPMEQLAESIEKFEDAKIVIMETAFKGITEDLTKNGFKVIEEDAVLPPATIESKPEEKPVPTSELPPAAPTQATEEKHPYEIGFEEGRKNWKHQTSSKQIVEEIVQKNLYEKPYSWVSKYQEGFAKGWKFEEELMRHKNPALFETEENAEIKA